MAEQYRYILVDVVDDVLVLTITIPSLKLYETARDVEAECKSAVASAGARKVVVDIKQLGCITSVGFWPFLGLRHQLKEVGGDIVLCNVAEIVEEVFDKTRMLVNPRSPSAPFRLAASVDDAIKMLNES